MWTKLFLWELQRTLPVLIKLHQGCEAEVKWLNYTQNTSAQVKFIYIYLPTSEICYWHSQSYAKGHLRHSYSDTDQISFGLT